MKIKMAENRSSKFAAATVLLVALVFFGTLADLSAADIRRHKAEFTISEEPVSPAVDYNILLFDNLRLSLVGIVGVSYDDNITSARRNRRSSFYTTPRLRLGIDWPLTPNIHLGTGISAGYRYYFSEYGENRFIVSFIDDLATSAKADIYVGRGVLRLSNRFVRNTDGLDIGRTASRDYILNRNTFGVSYRMPLAPVWSGIARVSRRDTWTDTSEFRYHNNVRYLGSLTVLWQLNPDVQVGPYVSYEDVNYTSARGSAPIANNDREAVEGGLTFLARPLPRLLVEGNAGYQSINIGRSAFAVEQARGFTGRAAVRFASSEFTDHTLSITHDRNQDIVNPFVNYAQETTYMYGIASNIMRNLTVRGDIALVDIRESDFGENADLWRVGAGASYVLGPKVRARFRYEYWHKSSDMRAGSGTDYSYHRNRASIFLEYDF